MEKSSEKIDTGNPLTEDFAMSALLRLLNLAPTPTAQEEMEPQTSSRKHSMETRAKISNSLLGHRKSTKWSLEARSAASERARARAEANAGPAGYGRLRKPSTFRVGANDRHESISMRYDGGDTILFTPEQYQAFWEFSGLRSDPNKYESVVFELIPQQGVAICHGFRTLRHAGGHHLGLDCEVFGSIPMSGGHRRVRSTVIYFEAPERHRTPLVCLVTED